ncbi:hypothetical protein [Cupriavidus necator]
MGPTTSRNSGRNAAATLVAIVMEACATVTDEIVAQASMTVSSLIDFPDR